MSNRYAPLPNPQFDHDAQHEMEAAFDDSDDEAEATESHPLTRPSAYSPSHSRSFSTTQDGEHVPGAYDFEMDYTMPPPGSPPPIPTSSNGYVPSLINVDYSLPKPGWFRRALSSVLPGRFPAQPQVPGGPLGGGTNNDGVFANMTAKPNASTVNQDGDETYIVPEDSRTEVPPSYASAQADAVPPYWETTVHAPFSSDSVGEMIIDSLPTGSLFSFLWNMLVSISFQFVGFLLTYLLHTTHAARLGSRAGLGVTLIQYGFALRSRVDAEYTEGGNSSIWDIPQPQPGETPADEMYHKYQMSGNGTTMDTLTEEQASALIADATTEWLSFFLMTVGWFILLTSLLGFWRVKRWENGILASQRPEDSQNSQPSNAAPVPSQFERLFGLNRLSSRANFIRQGFGLGANEEEDHIIRAAEEGENETAYIAIDTTTDPERARAMQQAIENELQLQADLRAAGLL